MSKNENIYPSFEKCVADAKKAFENIERSKYEMQKKNKHKIRKRIVPIGFLDGIKFVEIIR
jgi:hypothetical protein